VVSTAGEIGINIYGLSYHPDRRDSAGKSFNELNVGIGLNYALYETHRSIFPIEGGIFKNSGGDVAKYIGAGYLFKFGRGISAGGEAVYFDSKTYNNGHPAFGIVPMVSYRYKPLSFTVMYLPKYKNINQNAAFGLYGTVHFGGKN
jgi:hypothetical protein